MLLVNTILRFKIGFKLLAAIAMASLVIVLFSNAISREGRQQVTLGTETELRLGERLTIAACGQCHFGDDGLLSGKRMTDVPRIFGKIYSPNITSDSTFGIGAWTYQNIRSFLRTGIKPNGKKANLIMPRYHRMSDPDLNAIISFLKSGGGASASSAEKTRTSKRSIPFRIAALAKEINSDDPVYTINKPDTLQSVVYGKYLVDDVLHCFNCHSSGPAGVNFLQPDKSKGYMGGGSKFPGLQKEKIISLNLTSDEETGIGSYTKDDFHTVMKTGKRKNGSWIRYPMLPYPTLTENDIKAIYTYLMTVPKIHNKKLRVR